MSQLKANHAPEVALAKDVGCQGSDFMEAPSIDRPAKEDITIADALKAAGYAAGISGKWHLAGPAAS